MVKQRAPPAPTTGFTCVSVSPVWLMTNLRTHRRGSSEAPEGRDPVVGIPHRAPRSARVRWPREACARPPRARRPSGVGDTLAGERTRGGSPSREGRSAGARLGPQVASRSRGAVQPARLQQAPPARSSSRPFQAVPHRCEHNGGLSRDLQHRRRQVLPLADLETRGSAPAEGLRRSAAPPPPVGGRAAWACPPRAAHTLRAPGLGVRTRTGLGSQKQGPLERLRGSRRSVLRTPGAGPASGGPVFRVEVRASLLCRGEVLRAQPRGVGSGTQRPLVPLGAPAARGRGAWPRCPTGTHSR